MWNFAAGYSIKITLRHIPREAFCRDNRYPSAEVQVFLHPPFLFLLATLTERGEGGEDRKEFFERKGSREGRLTTCHTLRAWHAGLIIPWQRVSIRLERFSFHENGWRRPRERIKEPRRCAGLDRSFLSSYRIHLDAGSAWGCPFTFHFDTHTGLNGRLIIAWQLFEWTHRMNNSTPI